jgi:hypothetical protein
MLDYGQRHASTALPTGNRPGAPFTRGWMDPITGLDACGKSHFHWDLTPGPSTPSRVAMPTELSQET